MFWTPTASVRLIGRRPAEPVALVVSCQNQLLMRWGKAAGLAGAEASVAEHAVNLGEGVRVAVGRGAEHPHGEKGSVGRGYAIFVRHELNHSDETAGLQRLPDSFEQCYIGREIEVVQEVGQERYVVAGTEGHFECAARDCAETPRNSHFRSIFSGHFKNVFPILEDDFSGRVV